ncbi:MAG: glycosyltransferase family 2 protein [Bernardetiaceae bacterium]|nr:glycosyltransferase family 2 protein [Bernardetiaceae bacterium]
MLSSTRIAVVILNYNGEQYLADFLPSVCAYSPEAEVIVADNASTDQSIAFLEKAYPQLRIIQNSENQGFAQGYNSALKHIEAEFEYYVLLNSDVEVTPNWLSPLLAYMDANPEMAACQPKIKAYHRKAYFEYAGAAGGFLDRYGYPFCRGRLFDEAEQDTAQYDDNSTVVWATGAALFIRAELYHKYEGLDADFFAHMEEIDLCWRLQNAGYTIGYCAGSTVFHVGGGTLSQLNPRKTYFNFRNGIVMLLKNLPQKMLWSRLPIRITLDAVAALQFFLSGKAAHGSAVGQAYRYLLRHRKSILAKRKKIQKLTGHGIPPKTYKGSIVVDFFLRGKKKYSELSKTKF